MTDFTLLPKIRIAMLLATDFMCEAMAAVMSIPGLTWESPNTCLNVVCDGSKATIFAAFSFTGPRPAPPPQLLTVKAWTAVSSEGVMSLEIFITSPQPDGDIVIREKLVYPYDPSDPAWAIDPAFTSQQRAKTHDLTLRLFRAAKEFCTGRAEIELEPGQVLHSDTSEVFSLFALSRMCRWGVVALEESSAALLLLQRGAARQTTNGRTSPPAELDKWFGGRLLVGRPHDVYLDSILYDIELNARHRMFGVMANPPMNDPVLQLLLLHQAVSAHPAVWASVHVIASPELVFALGMDLEPEQVPLQAIEPLLAGFSNLLSRPRKMEAIPAVREWLNVSPLA